MKSLITLLVLFATLSFISTGVLAAPVHSENALSSSQLSHSSPLVRRFPKFKSKPKYKPKHKSKSKPKPKSKSKSKSKSKPKPKPGPGSKEAATKKSKKPKPDSENVFEVLLDDAEGFLGELFGLRRV